jgi:hypothetical protein
VTEDTRPKLSFVEQMMQLRDAIAPLGAEFGITTSRSLIISRREVNQQSILIQFFEVLPQPIIERVPPSMATNFNGNQQIKIDDLRVFGVTRKYPREWIVGTGISYFVDATLLHEQVKGGFECEFVSIEEMPLTWNLILRRRADERRGV